MRSLIRSAVSVFVVLAFGPLALAQIDLGTPRWGSFAGGPDVVNLGNLNVNLTIPIRHKMGRGQNFDYDLQYDSTVYYPVTSNGTTYWQPTANWGWQGLSNAGTVYETYYESYSSGSCGMYGQNSWQSWTYNNLIYSDEHGVEHTFNTGTSSYTTSNGSPPYCPPTASNPPGTLTVSANDDSGLKAQYYVDSSGFHATIYTAGGQSVNPPVMVNYSSPAGNLTSTDQNGNQITSSNGTYTDTLGQEALSVLTSGSTTTLQYANAQGTFVGYTATYGSYNIHTNFGCSVTEYSASNVSLVNEISLPDGRSYQFTYEQTPGMSGYYTGRIASIILPTGATISYQYTGGNNGIVCANGSAAGLNRTTPDGEWQYSRSGSGTQWQTIATAPSYNGAQNQTVMSFLTDIDGNYYEIERQVYAGSSSSGTLLQTVLHCYELTNCSSTKGDNGTSVSTQVVQITTTVQWPNNTGISTGSVDGYDTTGNLLSHAVYDYGSAGSGSFSQNPLQTTKYTYWTNPSTSYETTLPSEIQVLDSGNAVISDTKYGYDQTSTVATSGTPQHVASPSGSPGNLTTIQRLVSGSTWQTATFTNFDTGNVQKATDFNGTNVTTYSYTACGNSLPTSSSTPVKNPSGTVTATLTTSEAWNCTGGVPSSSTDANNNTTRYNYGSDPYWRPVTVTDPAGNVTSYSYPSSSSAASSVSLSFNGSNSISDTVTISDALGRTALQQTKQGPGSSNYDSVAYLYDSYGRLQCQTEVPYTGGYESYTAPTTSTGKCATYDALGRPTGKTDAGGGSVSYSYGTNTTVSAYTIYVNNGPAPTGENSKRRLLGYNGASQLTSVCEITSLSGSGSCGTGSGYNGYLTQYMYDGTRLTKTQQNVQAGGSNVQARQVSYDALGRKLSETIPEWSNGSGSPGTATYVYDSDSTCGSTSNGDLIKTTDNEGNVTCNTYDSIHRVLSSAVTSGSPYASVTPVANFVYDSAACNGTTMLNVAGTLAEAYTGSSGSKTTDLCFSNSFSTSGVTSGGVTSTVWESTPHSSGYYVTTDTYFPNGVLGIRSSTYGLPTFTYGLDGEGRLNAATDSTNSLNIVTAASYNAAGVATGVTYGNGDSDTFGYDSNTNRPTSLLYTITGGSPFTVTTNLTWNPNGSLKQMQITDTNDSSKNQTCQYAADDLSRIASVSCGGAWAQTFAYDAFGNIKNPVAQALMRQTTVRRRTRFRAESRLCRNTTKTVTS